MNEFLKAMTVAILIGLAAATISILGAASIGVPAGRLAVQNEAVEHGAARWAIDANGRKRFEWTTTKE